MAMEPLGHLMARIRPSRRPRTPPSRTGLGSRPRIYGDHKSLEQSIAILRTIANENRYYGRVDDFAWPPEVRAYNNNFTKVLSIIKRRHDPVVTTMGTPLTALNRFQSLIPVQPKEFWSTKSTASDPRSIPKSNLSSTDSTCPASASVCSLDNT